MLSKEKEQLINNIWNPKEINTIPLNIRLLVLTGRILKTLLIAYVALLIFLFTILAFLYMLDGFLINLQTWKIW